MPKRKPKPTSEKDIAKAVGKELRANRAQLGWVRDDLVANAALDIHVQTIAGYETGTRHMTVARFVMLCNAMRVNPLNVLERALATLNTNFTVTPESIELLADHYGVSTVEVQQALKNY